MLKAKYDWVSNIDEQAKWYINQQKEQMLAKEDDRLYLVVGETGVGKSMLTFHLLEQYEPNLEMRFIVQERKDFAKALKTVKDEYVAGKRNLYLWFDEADTDNLEQQARWNKKLFGMYMKLRKLAILHFWCFPSLKALDRRFIEEKVRGVFLCYDKAKHRPRNYVFFNKKAILDMVDAKIRLTIPNLKKAKKKYGFWMGYYKDYKGALREAYDNKKVSSMSDAVDGFYDEFSGMSDAGKRKTPVYTTGTDVTHTPQGIYTPDTFAKEYGITPDTARKRLKKLFYEGKVPPQVYDGARIEFGEDIADLMRNSLKHPYRGVRK